MVSPRSIFQEDVKVEVPSFYYVYSPTSVKFEILQDDKQTIVSTLSIKYRKLMNKPVVEKLMHVESGETYAVSVSMVPDFEREVKDSYLNLSLLELVDKGAALYTIDRSYVTEYEVACSAKNLKKMDFFSKSDPFFTITVNQSYSESEVIKDNLNPKWKPIRAMCNGRIHDNTALHFSVYDWDEPNDRELIDHRDTTYGFYKGGTNEYRLRNGRGILVIDEFKILKESFTEHKTPKFPDLAKSFNIKCDEIFYRLTRAKGLKFGVYVAVDFNSFSDVAVTEANTNFKMITKLLKKVKPFSSNKYSAYGFGAKLVNQSETLPFFNLNLSSENEEFEGVKTNDFCSIIDHVSQKSSRKDSGLLFNILIIITTGKEFDIQSTIDSIVECNENPMTVVLVGVGNGDLSKLANLAAENTLTHRNGTKLTRDVVHFVNVNTSPKVSAQVLREIPNAVARYYASVLPEEIH